MDQLIISLAYKFNGWGLALYVLVTTLLAGVLSGIIGIEREIKGQAAGLRTHVLVSVGCVLIMVVSIFGIGLASGQIDLSKGYIDPNLIKYDTARIAAGITAGIGFVSAGTIIRNGFSVRGLTTAATLWVCSGIGMACGCGLILEAMVPAAVTMGLLMGLLFHRKGDWEKKPSNQNHRSKGRRHHPRPSFAGGCEWFDHQKHRDFHRGFGNGRRSHCGPRFIRFAKLSSSFGRVLRVF